MTGGASSMSRQIATVFLLSLSFILFFWFGAAASLTRFELCGLIIAAILSLLSPSRVAIDRAAARINLFLGERLGAASVGASVFTAVYLLIVAWHGRDFLFLKINDEHAYMIQAHLLAQGRLWMPPYPPAVAPFVDALGLIVDRVYAPMYFPGTALIEVPFLLAGLPFWVMPLAAASVSAGLLFRLAAEIFDPVRGLIAVLLLVPLRYFSTTSTLLLSEFPFLLAELTMLLAWLAFRKRPGWMPALLLGTATGFAAITRPVDAACFALPIGIAIFLEFRKKPAWLARWAGVTVAGAAPFLILLLVQNIGVSGHWYEFAESYYNRENFPASPMGFHHPDTRFIPIGMNGVKQQWLETWVLPSFRHHYFWNALRSWPRGRFAKFLLPDAVPQIPLRILLSVAVLPVFEKRRMVMTAALLLFMGFNFFYLFLLDHYVVAIMPSMICLVLMGWEAVARAWPNAKPVPVFLLLAVSLLSLEPFGKLPPVDQSAAPDQRPANALLGRLTKTPAVVLFRFDPRVESFNDDPVYNDSVAWPDDALVVRARDLGPERNQELIRYYARRQPDRLFYVYDPDLRAAGENPLSGPLGTAAELAR